MYPDQQLDNAAPPVMPPPTEFVGPPPPPVAAGRRWWIWVALFVAAVLVAALSTAYVLTRPDPIEFAVGDCLSIADNSPVEYRCSLGVAHYSIVAREDVKWPLDEACAKNADATKAVTEPLAKDEKPSVVLCLAPTRVNMTDPGAILAGDCVKVTGAGDSITRAPCTSPDQLSRVLATEIHRQVPVTDQACRDVPETRQAYAQPSLGGRAIVVCVRAFDPTYLGSAEVGSCVDKNAYMLLSCEDPAAYLRVLEVRTGFQKPAKPECLGIINASSVSTTSNDKTDFVLILCMGPADQSDVGYAQVGDCVIPPTADAPTRPTKADCADPAAVFEVQSRYETNDGQCPANYNARFARNPNVTNGMTLCLTRK